ncbi:hydroxymethylbilane synthase [Lachnospiraceae bacterium]|nr:hydroxymethylbilane synthase [Lachnospiraceae bacterium]
MQTIRIGTRQSRLALIQAELLADYIRHSCPGLRAELVAMKTTGDKILDRKLDEIGGKGLFVKELDCALREGRSDVSVHSLKDVPAAVPRDLPLLGFSCRADARDVLVLPKGADVLDTLRPLGCSSARRTVQLRRLFPKMEIKSIRGNVLTRLEKLDQGQYGGLVLAAAGLKRLGLEERISRYFSVEELVPAAGQGILAVQGRQGEEYGYLEGFFDTDSTYCALAERSFIRTLEGGCSSPLAAYAAMEAQGKMKLTGMYAKEGSLEFYIDSVTGWKEEAEKLGRELAVKMRR